MLTDCLAKTQVSANLNKGGIEAETCPVLVSQESRVTPIHFREAFDLSSSERQL